MSRDLTLTDVLTDDKSVEYFSHGLISWSLDLLVESMTRLCRVANSSHNMCENDVIVQMKTRITMWILARKKDCPPKPEVEVVGQLQEQTEKKCKKPPKKLEREQLW